MLQLGNKNFDYSLANEPRKLYTVSSLYGIVTIIPIPTKGLKEIEVRK